MKSKSTLCCAIAALGFASLAALAIDGISAAKARPVASTPRLAIVALSEQRVSIYDATGKILGAPVSTGAIGYETPAGIYSIVQKEKVHHSNLYDDASMPFMERITWTGMALHAGVLPGYAASHGCVRMPHAFAEQLYQLTELGLRVVVVRGDIVPADFAQPALFSSPGGAKLTINLFNRLSEASLREQLQSIAAVKTAEAEAAMKREKEARMAAAKKAAEAAPAAQALRVAEANLAKAEADLKAAERAPQTAGSRVQIAKVEAAKKQARIKFEAAQAQLKAAKLQAQSKLEAAAQAETDAKAADTTMIGAVQEAEIAKQNTSPVSVFVSRKAQRLYIRKGNQPVFESPVTIRDADKPIGTFVFTALNYTRIPGEMRWNVVSMYRNATNIEPYVPVKRVSTNATKQADPAPADAAGAQAALDRLVVPREAASRISEVVLPGSSLIISDEGPSIETGKDTDFVIFISGEPQGGIAIRHRKTAARRARNFGDDLFARSWRGSGGWRSRGGAGGFFSPFGH